MADVFASHLEWSGAACGPTHDPATFSRDLEASIGARTLPMSAAPGFRGNPERLNPEQLLVASVSGCQALTYLFVAAKNGIGVLRYADDAEGRLGVVNGRMCVSRITLRPQITLAAGANEAKARELVARAHRDCFIANSLSIDVEIAPSFQCSGVAVAAE